MRVLVPRMNCALVRYHVLQMLMLIALCRGWILTLPNTISKTIYRGRFPTDATFQRQVQSVTFVHRSGNSDWSENKRHVKGSILDYVNNVRQLETLSNDILRSELKLRGLSELGSKIQMVLRLAEAMDLLRRRISNPLPSLDSIPLEIQEKWKNQERPRVPIERKIKENRILDEELNFDDNETSIQTENEWKRLPPNPEYVRQRTLVDGLFRKTGSYTASDGNQAEFHIVSSRKALRPWDAQVRAAMDRKDEEKQFSANWNDNAYSAEVRAVMLISDHFGWEHENIRNLAKEIAYICDCIVCIPDIFRGNSFSTYKEKKIIHQDEGFEENSLREDWITQHTRQNVMADVELALSSFKEEYNPTSIGIIGCYYGGGLALDLSSQTEVDAIVACCPTDYDSQSSVELGTAPILTLLGGDSTSADASTLKQKFGSDDRLKDYMIKFYPGEKDGFVYDYQGVHSKAGKEVFLLATAWMDLYLQKTRKTFGTPVKESEGPWNYFQ